MYFERSGFVRICGSGVVAGLEETEQQPGEGFAWKVQL